MAQVLYKWHMHAAPGTPELLTAEQVAQIFQVAKSTVSRWGSDGTLATVRIGRGRGTVRYRRDDIERLLSAGEAKEA